VNENTTLASKGFWTDGIRLYCCFTIFPFYHHLFSAKKLFLAWGVGLRAINGIDLLKIADLFSKASF